MDSKKLIPAERAVEESDAAETEDQWAAAAQNVVVSIWSMVVSSVPAPTGQSVELGSFVTCDVRTGEDGSMPVAFILR